ncbi:MAG TPA: tRNA 2-thiouridine(34) synthase MnmA [candidate division Zixibacteria bacterium]|nr:tRNA 2-thiouridine(34) synthase MnmA [candidate division Zixibacteria bacterium]
MATVFVALSGGVDSSVAAAVLKDDGFDVVGGHITCWDGCEQGEERRDARRVAFHLGIPFLTFDLRREYRARVFDSMVREYAAGRTPNPDVMCNREIKFGAFLERALRLGADYIATGHYARLERGGGIGLFEGADKQKDQSYFLWSLAKPQLERSLFPLSRCTKSEVRRMARQWRLPTAEKKDSQGLCFVGKVSFGDFLRELLPRRPGPIVTADGTRIGEHDGLAFYTIGQRHGLGIGGGAPYYVAAKQPETDTLVVGVGPGDPVLYRKEIVVSQLNWISGSREGRYEVRIRYRQPKVAAVVEAGPWGVRVVFDEPQRGVAPGQSAVFYDGEQVLGGGIIEY